MEFTHFSATPIGQVHGKSVNKITYNLSFNLLPKNAVL